MLRHTEKSNLHHTERHKYWGGGGGGGEIDK